MQLTLASRIAPRALRCVLFACAAERELHGRPCSPAIPPAGGVLVRYAYDGGSLLQGRLCTLTPQNAEIATGAELLRVLEDDGVDLERFYPCAYEQEESGGGWLPVTDAVAVPLVPPRADDDTAPPSRRRWEHAPRSAPQRRRIDLKLCRRDYSVEAETAHAYSQAGSGALPRGSYHAVGIYGPKTEDNVGSLWRSALQMGAAFIFTINARFPLQRLKTDTLQTHCRIPYIPHDKWSNFVEAAPLGAKWVAVEMGGEPLDSFEHPERALYILGSEDTGLPQSVIDACHERVALPSVRYSSYNVAVAGSIVLYDRLAKERRRDAEEEAARRATEKPGIDLRYPAAGPRND